MFQRLSDDANTRSKRPVDGWSIAALWSVVRRQPPAAACHYFAAAVVTAAGRIRLERSTATPVFVVRTGQPRGLCKPLLSVWLSGSTQNVLDGFGRNVVVIIIIITARRYA